MLRHSNMYALHVILIRHASWDYHVLV